MTQETRDYTAEYHAHLDTCTRCNRTPLDPCALGGWLLIRAETQIEHTNRRNDAQPQG